MNTYFPGFYNPTQIGTVRTANLAVAIEAGLKVGWSPASRDQQKIALVLVDCQDDFCQTTGALSVPGALGDIQRMTEFIYRNGAKITAIAPTIDTHYPLMIFFPSWWVGKDGQHPAPFTIISEDDIRQGKWRALIDPGWSHAYVSKLALDKRDSLMIWPYHCLDMSDGINVVAQLAEAVQFHAAARYSQPIVLHKGHIPQTEFYSPLEPEVPVPQVPGGTLNMPFINMLMAHDVILVAGEAKSHCVKAFMRSLVTHFSGSQPEVLRRVRFLMDCTSSVQHPAVDFDAIANTQLCEWQSQYGIQLVKSTEVTL